MTFARLFALVALVGLNLPFSGHAQPAAPRDKLLRCVPKDFGLCLIVQDLRGHFEQWDKSPWIQSLKNSTLGKAVLESPEARNLLKFQGDLKRHLDVDWPSLRDDVLGDAVVFAYRPAPAEKAEEEQGLFLLHARRPATLTRLIDNLNKAQLASGEVTSLEKRSHQGIVYFCRVEPKDRHFYLQDGSFFAYAGRENLIQKIIEQRQQKEPGSSPAAEHLRKSGADRAVAALWLDPRSLDTEFQTKGKDLRGAEGLLFKDFLKNWQALDGFLLSFRTEESLELKFSLLARGKEMSPLARQLLLDPTKPSDLWNWFPDNPLLAVAGRLNFGEVTDSLAEITPQEVRKVVKGALQPVAAMAGLDLQRDVMPNLGPDWGFAVVPHDDSKKMPQAILALGVQAGTKNRGVDQAVYRGIQMLAGFSLFDYNRRHPREPIRLKTVRQDKVEIKYLSHERLFPPGFQPALALKEGYLLLTTDPEAVARFGKIQEPLAATSETPLAKISATALAKFIRAQRTEVVQEIAAKNQISKESAAQGLDSALSVLDLFERLELTHTGGSDQASWILRVLPARPQVDKK